MQKWTTQDRYGHLIYLTDERWEHITCPANHPEMAGYCDHLKKTITTGKRKQYALDPRKYRYIQWFDDLTEANNCIAAVVQFRFETDKTKRAIENNFVLTAYQKNIRR